MRRIAETFAYLHSLVRLLSDFSLYSEDITLLQDIVHLHHPISAAFMYNSDSDGI